MMTARPDKSFFEESRTDIARQVSEQMSRLDDGSILPLNTRMAIASRILSDEGHGRTLAGQITARASGENAFCTLPFDTGFADARPSVVLRINGSMQVLEGSGIPNPAVRFHMWIYENISGVNSIVHTHPPSAYAISMIGEQLVVAHMDATLFYEDCAYLPNWPGVPIDTAEGEVIARAL